MKELISAAVLIATLFAGTVVGYKLLQVAQNRHTQHG